MCERDVVALNAAKFVPLPFAMVGVTLPRENTGNGGSWG